jgi:hypothetical protein
MPEMVKMGHVFHFQLVNPSTANGDWGMGKLVDCWIVGLESGTDWPGYRHRG